MNNVLVQIKIGVDRKKFEIDNTENKFRETKKKIVVNIRQEDDNALMTLTSESNDLLEVTH